MSSNTKVNVKSVNVNKKKVRKSKKKKEKEDEGDKYWNKWDNYQEDNYCSYIPWLGTYTEADRAYDEKYHPNGETNYFSPDAIAEVENGFCEPEW